MSILIHIKGIVLTHFSGSDELKGAVLDILNSVDSDLDTINYDEDNQSDATREAIRALDEVLAPSEDEVDEEEVPNIKRISPVDLNDEEDDNNDTSGPQE